MYIWGSYIRELWTEAWDDGILDIKIAIIAFYMVFVLFEFRILIPLFKGIETFQLWFIKNKQRQATLVLKVGMS